MRYMVVTKNLVILNYGILLSKVTKLNEYKYFTVTTAKRMEQAGRFVPVELDDTVNNFGIVNKVCGYMT
ncbi:hypothetical protein acsn021_35210 [Anaerocolumna cellulosilytica]|uniref:Uncharacterized protein n=1 Tax=Anaerocolumna cellulosilytica TaxID=433286 RepID=A0A6S6R9K9_9FIRM|nr:hypothetical protein acsn021_35210 [Anaerocolumna cellulosilytica]